ncbi:MAG: hypothetical protein FJ215_07215 [Ignavibacteria bacterium]|nr:hypothetical protein [Ignavibacteria bacterium]
MFEALGEPDIVAELPSVRLLEPRVNRPFVSESTPLAVAFIDRETPFELSITRVEFVFVVRVPEPDIVCAEDPFRLTVPGEAGLKARVAPDATEMFPLTA